MSVPPSPRSSVCNQIDEDRELLSIQADISDTLEPFQSRFGQGIIKFYDTKMVYTQKGDNLAFIKLNEEVSYNTVIDDRNGNCYIKLTKNKKQNYILLTQENLKLVEDQLKKSIFRNDFYSYYDVVDLVGNGTYSQVSLVKDKRNGNQYAAKTISKSRINSSNQNKKELMNEINLLRKVNHQKVLRAHEFYETDNAYKLVLEYYSGQTLESRMKEQKQFKLQSVCSIMKQILEGLVYLHSQNIMHRDLKPENILFVSNNSLDIIIGDIGFAQDVNQDFVLSKCGTPGYIAPEIMHTKGGRDYDMKVDMFSCGVIFYRLASGKSLFNGKTIDDVLEDNRRFRIDLSAKEFVTLPQKIQQIIQSMLELNPEKRITAEQALQSQFYNLTDEQENQICVIQNSPLKMQDKYKVFNYLKEGSGSKNSIRPGSGSKNSIGNRHERSSSQNYFPQQVKTGPARSSFRMESGDFRIGKNEKQKIEEQLSNVGTNNSDVNSPCSARNQLMGQLMSCQSVGNSPMLRNKTSSVSKPSHHRKLSSKDATFKDAVETLKTPSQFSFTKSYVQS